MFHYSQSILFLLVIERSNSASSPPTVSGVKRVRSAVSLITHYDILCRIGIHVIGLAKPAHSL